MANRRRFKLKTPAVDAPIDLTWRTVDDLKLKTPAVDAPIDLTWRTVDTYQRGLQDQNLRKAGRTRGRSLILA